MRTDPTPLSATSGWTLILADVVALMLAFFVLTFSMREMVGGERPELGSQSIERGSLIDGFRAAGAAATPGAAAPLALAPAGGRVADQLQPPEQAAGGTPSLAYLAAIIQGAGFLPPQARVWHDDTMLVVDLPNGPSDGGRPLAAEAEQPLLALAFLARRFDLALTVTFAPEAAMTAGAGPGLAGPVGQALLIRDWLADAAGGAALEVTFVTADGSVMRAGRSAPARAALLVKPTTGDRAVGSR